MKALVIGVGNSLRRDDGAGPYIAERLPGSPNLSVISCQQLTPELAEPVSQADRVIFVDADARLAPGEVVRQAVQAQRSARIHELDPGALLEWARTLYGRTPEATLVAIGAESFDVGEGLSPAVERAAQEALRAISMTIAGPYTCDSPEN